MTVAAEKTAGQVLLGWWSTHIHADTGAARALAARLRRAEGPVAVLAEGPVIGLVAELGAVNPALAGALRKDPVRLAVLAQVLASVKKHEGRTLAQLFGAGDPKALSEMRFQRLLRSPDLPALGQALRRALPMVDHGCNVAALGADILNWNEDTRIRWCFHYFGAAAPETPAAAPAAAATEDDA